MKHLGFADDIVLANQIRSNTKTKICDFTVVKKIRVSGLVVSIRGIT